MFDCNFSYLWIAAVALGLYLLRKYFKGGLFTEPVSARGKVVVVSGGNTGIGLETVKELNLRGALYTLCRSEARASEAKAQLAKTGCDANRLIYVNCDLGSLDNVRKCAGRLNQRPFLPTELLLPLIEKAPEGRIVNVASLSNTWASAIDLAKINSDESFSQIMAYSKSKLANASRVAIVNCVGAIITEIHRNGHIGYQIFRLFSTYLIGFFMKSWKDGAQTTLYCAVSTDLKGVSGRYYSDCAPKSESVLARDDLACKQLNDYSLRADGL